MLDEVEQRRNSSFLHDPSCTKFVPVVPKIPSCFQTSKQINCLLPSITALRTPLFFFSLLKNFRPTQPVLQVKEGVSCLLPGGENSDQWATNSHWILHLPLGRSAKKGIYWTIYTAYLLSLTHCYILIDRP